MHMIYHDITEIFTDFDLKWVCLDAGFMMPFPNALLNELPAPTCTPAEAANGPDSNPVQIRSTDVQLCSCV